MNREEAENALHDVVLFARACYKVAYSKYDIALREGKRPKSSTYNGLVYAGLRVNVLEDELQKFYLWTIPFKDVEANSPVTNKEGNNGV